jgi:hypothetical protein
MRVTPDPQTGATRPARVSAGVRRRADAAAEDRHRRPADGTSNALADAGSTAPALNSDRMSHGIPAVVQTGRRRSVHVASVAVLVAATALLGVTIPASVHAETTHALALVGSVSDLFTNIRNWLMGILFGLATVFFSVGGVRYLLAHGDPGEVEAAKRAFKSAGIGYALAALAPLVATILQGIVGGP